MRVLKYLIAAPIAALILVFAFANREWVTIYFDPIGGSGLAPVPAPQYAVLLIAAALGVIAGSVTTWVGQGWRRRALREAEAEAARLRQELQSQRFTPPPTFTRQA
jgi:hypothetical protein